MTQVTSLPEETEAYRLMDIYSEIEEELGSPYGNWNMTKEEHVQQACKVIDALVVKLKEEVDLNNFDRKVWDILEDENYHTLCLAIDIAQGKTSFAKHMGRYC